MHHRIQPHAVHTRAGRLHGELPRMAEGKGSASLDGVFAMLTEEEPKDIKVVSGDRGNAYVKAVREHLPHAELSFDPFHVIKNINDAVTEVRRTQCAWAGKQRKGIIKDQRCALLKAPENLSGRQRVRHETLLKMNAPIIIAKVLKEQARDARHIPNYFRYKPTSGRIEVVNFMIARVLHMTNGVGSVDYPRLKLRAPTSPVFRFPMGRETGFA